MIIIKEDGSGQSQMRSEMRENMRHNYRGNGGSWVSSGQYRGGNYRTEEAYREGYRHGWEDSEDDMNEEHYRRSRDSRGRFI